MSEIDRTAREGFSAGAAAYAAGRPGYPAALSGWLTDTLRLGPGKTAVDLGAGTGKFTPLLAATGAHVWAIEPVAEMRAHIAAAAPGVDALDGSAEALPLADASVDAVVSAQAFHWFATPAALAEIRRALKLGGRLGLVWNVRDESVPWVVALAGLIAPYEGDTPRFSSGRWRDVFPARGFGALEESRFPHAHVGPAERTVVDRLMSTSFVARLREPERRRIAGEARAILAAHGLDPMGEVAFPYLTHAFSCVRLS